MIILTENSFDGALSSLSTLIEQSDFEHLVKFKGGKWNAQVFFYL